jgi:glycolate oxidase
VLPDGRVQEATPESDPPLDWFVGAEGTLGVLTEIELQIRPQPDAESPSLWAFDGLGSLQEAILALARAEPRPYTVFFADEDYQEFLERAGFPPVTRQPMLLVAYEGETRPANLPGQELAIELAVEEWAARFYHLRAKRAGPSLIAAEMVLPLGGLAGYLRAVAELSRQVGTLMGTYGLVLSPTRALVNTVYGADERRTIGYLVALSLTKRLYDLGAERGGKPYGVGVWNTPYLSRLFTRERLAELRARKARLDPWGIMNPGKLYHAPWPLNPVIFRPAAELLVRSARFSAGL